MEIPADISAFASSLSDEEALRFAAAVRTEEAGERWAEIAATFPEIDRDTWPIDYAPVLAWREAAEALVTAEGISPKAVRAWYRNRPHEFIEHWGTTYDPRNAGTGLPTRMPMLLFQRQREFLDWLLACLDTKTHGLAEKTRDFGLSWLAVFFSIWAWTTWEEAPAIGFGSQKEELVDVRGDPKTLFEKIRMAIRFLPWFMQPDGLIEKSHLTERNCANPETGASIVGEIGDNIGRGGRTLIYFKDEAAHYQHPEMIEAALGNNTNVQIDISTPNGLGNVFHRRRMAGEVWIPSAEMPNRKASVFIADWREHPGKDQAWYDAMREQKEAEGLLHLFKQEVERDYAASVEGTIIPAEWVMAAIDAHLKLGIGDDGPWSGALDIADGGGDVNADAWFKGIVLRELDTWSARDTGETTRRFLDHAEGKGHVELQYDAGGGWGSGVKAEANRLADEGAMSPLVRLVPWVGAAAPLDPDEPVIPGDRDSPTNRDFYENMKAQAWWRTRQRFEKTWRAVQSLKPDGKPYTWNPEDLISIDSRIPHLRQLEDELSQPTRKPGSRRLVVDKTPEGTKSPNLADAFVMAANPTSGLKPIITVAKNQFECAPFKMPGHFRKGFAIRVAGQRVVALWAAHDPDADMLYFTTEYVRDYAEPGIHAQAITARGKWIPGTFDCDVANLKQADELQRLYHGHGIAILVAGDRAAEAGIADLQQRISTGRLKVFSTCQEFFTDYRGYRRDGDGKIVGGGLMECARQLARPEAIKRMKVEPRTEVRGGKGMPNLYR